MEFVGPDLYVILHGNDVHYRCIHVHTAAKLALQRLWHHSSEYRRLKIFRHHAVYTGFFIASFDHL
jgi:hypothetical protein